MTDEETPSDELVRELRHALGAFDAPRDDTGRWRADVMWVRFTERWRREEDSKRRQVRRSGLDRLGNQTLRRSVWTAVMASVTAGIIFLARQVSETRTDVTRVYSTNAQQYAVVNLDDGSRVTLAPHSTLRLQHFGMHARAIVLDGGEAYFEVTHISKMPFIVRSGAAITQVLGTSFLVRHTIGDPHVHVAVTDGRVRVMTPMRSHEGITLTAGQVGDVTDSTTQVSTTDDLAPGTERAPGRIMFRHTPLATVLQMVSQWYGYHFRYVDQTLAAQRVTVMISTQSSAVALAAIEHVLAVNLTIIGDTVTLVPQPVHSSQSAPRIRAYDVWIPTREVGR